MLIRHYSMTEYAAHLQPYRGAALSPYKLVIHWRHGLDQVYATGYSPGAVRAFETKIARDGRVIDKITLQDSSILETIWNRSWEPR